jgi:hypothetical protein
MNAIRFRRAVGARRTRRLQLAPHSVRLGRGGSEDASGRRGHAGKHLLDHPGRQHASSLPLDQGRDGSLLGRWHMTRGGGAGRPSATPAVSPDASSAYEPSGGGTARDG